MGSLFRQIQNIHQDGKGLAANTVEAYMRDLRRFRRFVTERYRLSPLEVETPVVEEFLNSLFEAGAEKSTQNRTLSGVSRLLRLPAAHGRAGKVACRIRRTSQIRPLPARHAEYRRDRCHPRCDRRIDRPRLPQPDDDRDALQLRATRIGTHVAAHLRPFFSTKVSSACSAREQTAPRPGQRPLPHAGGDLPARIPRNTGR